MMAREKMTSEEKLLRMIETPSLGKKERRGTAAQNIDYVDKAKLWFKVFLAEKRYAAFLNFKNIKKILLSLCVGFTIFLVVDFKQHREFMENKYLEIQKKEPADGQEKTEGLILEADLEASLTLAKERNIFSFEPPSGLEVEQKIVEAAPREDFDKLIENFTLVGIIWSETTPQAIIENSATNRTMLLSPGQEASFFRIKEIRIDSVIVEKDDKEWTLR